MLPLNFLCTFQLLKTVQNLSMSSKTVHSKAEMMEEEHGRKKTWNPALQKCKTANMNRKHSEVYSNVITNKCTCMKVIGKPYHNGCCDKVTHDGAESIFKAFWNLQDHNFQIHYLQFTSQTEAEWC